MSTQVVRIQEKGPVTIPLRIRRKNQPDDAAGFTTIELKTNFLGTTRDGAILCEGRPAHIGRRTMVWDARVWDEKTGRDIALFRCTQMILPKQA